MDCQNLDTKRGAALSDCPTCIAGALLHRVKTPQGKVGCVAQLLNPHPNNLVRRLVAGGGRGGGGCNDAGKHLASFILRHATALAVGDNRCNRALSHVAGLPHETREVVVRCSELLIGINHDVV